MLFHFSEILDRSFSLEIFETFPFLFKKLQWFRREQIARIFHSSKDET